MLLFKHLPLDLALIDLSDARLVNTLLMYLPMCFCRNHFSLTFSVWKSSYTSRKNCRGNKQLYGCTKPPPSLPLLQALYDLNLATAHTVSYLFTSEPKSSRNSTFRCENVTLIFIDNEPLTALSKQLKMFSSFCVRSPQYSISSKLRYSFVFSCTKKKKKGIKSELVSLLHWVFNTDCASTEYIP